MSFVDRILTLPDIVTVHADLRPAAPALTFADRSFTWAELALRTNEAAAALRAAGVGPGDRVAYLAKNTDRFFELLYACGKVGAVLTPLNWRLTPGEIAYQLGDSTPKIAFCADQFRGVLDEALAISGHGLTIVMFDGPAEDYDQWRTAHGATTDYAPLSPEDPAMILYTSGTTGNPKGAQLPHRALIELRREEWRVGPVWLQWRPDDLCVVSMPVFHIGGNRTAIAANFAGAQLLILPEFDAGKILELITTRPINKLFLVPSALQMLTRHPDAAAGDYSRLKYMVYGASPISVAQLQESLAVFKCQFIQAYGSTETAGGVLSLGPADHDPANPGRMASAGQVVSGVEVKIVDTDGQPVPQGEIGEVVIRSPSNMIGYWNLPGPTRETLSEDNWVRTGDAGYFDPDGFLFLRDRIKDMIITGGENVYPIEVENAVASHPAVAEVSVIGVPSEKWGEEVKACVVLRPGQAATEAEIIAWVRARIAGYKTPKSVDFIAAIPRNAGGKALKRELRRMMAPSPA